MRLFLAVEADATVHRAVESVVAEVRAAFDGGDPDTAREVKWVNPRFAHLTVHFLGDVADHVLPPLEQALKEPLALHPFTLEFGGVGAFPRGSGPVRVLWLGCTRGTADMVELHRLLGLRLLGLPITLEARPYSPHLTLGRFRSPGSSALRPLLASVAAKGVGTCPVSAVTLFRSQLSAAGPTYSVLSRTVLAS